MDTNAVQRHRAIILDCLRDGDISIRRRALELSYALINEQNVRVLIRELLAFLEVADNEFKLGMTTQVCAAAERFAPNRRWHIDTVLRVLKLVRIFLLLPPTSACQRLTETFARIAGWKLCSGRSPLRLHSTHHPHPGSPILHCLQTVHCAQSRCLAGISHARRSMDDRRIRRRSLARRNCCR